MDPVREISKRSVAKNLKLRRYKIWASLADRPL